MGEKCWRIIRLLRNKWKQEISARSWAGTANTFTSRRQIRTAGISNEITGQKINAAPFMRYLKSKLAKFTDYKSTSMK
jgi:hypothetical protein